MTIGEIMKVCEDGGSHFFEPSTIRFFGSRVLADVYEGPGGIFFVTSEKRKGMLCEDGPRFYTVRQFSATPYVRADGFHKVRVDISTAGKFQEHRTARAAKLVAAALASGYRSDTIDAVPK